MPFHDELMRRRAERIVGFKKKFSLVWVVLVTCLLFLLFRSC